MFFVYALISTIGYAFQSSLMVGYYRLLDTLSAITYRSLSLGFTMLPLALLGYIYGPNNLIPFIPTILLAGLLTTFAYWARALSYCVLPVGIAVGICEALKTIAVIICGVLFLSEFLTTTQLSILGFLLITIVILGILKERNDIPVNVLPIKGSIYCLVYGIFNALSIAMIANASRSIHPFLVAWSWQLSAGVFGLLIALIRGKLGRSSFQIVSKKDTFKITIYTSPSVIGTGFFALAISLGPIAIVSAIGTLTIVITTILAFYIYKEKLHLKQWILLILIMLSICLLKIIH